MSSTGLPGRVARAFVFRDKEYEVTSSVEDGQLLVQVEEKITADQWKNNFAPKHIEELTRKTGNFKQFPVFVNMLHSAILNSSDCVSLDLLTYTDLETLRNQKLGLTPGVSPGRKSSQLEAKRYLILTYTVEFDRIHYPLALPYSGKPDPVVLQQIIRKLQTELDHYKSGHGGKKYNGIQQDYDALLQEKEQLEEAFEDFKCQVVHSQDRKGSKEIRVLKKVIKNLEEELLRERSKHQRYSSKKNQELRELIQELKELRSSERILQARVKSLTNELAVLKRGRGLRASPIMKYGSSGKTTQVNRKRTLSSERQVTRQNNYRTPSPRFDPTAYVQEKARRQQEINQRLGKGGRKPRSRSSSVERVRYNKPPSGQPTSTSRQLYGSRIRTPSVGSGSSQVSSRRSSVSSDNGVTVERIKKRQLSSKKPATVRKAWNEPLVRYSPAEVTAKRKDTTPHNDSTYLERSREISEIDARLKALQEFMKKSLEPSKHHKK